MTIFSGLRKDKIPEYAFLLFFAILPFVDILAPIALGVMIGMAVIFKSQKCFLESFKSKRNLLFLAAYFFLALASLLYSEDVGETGNKIFKLIVFILLPLGFFLVDPAKDLLEKAMKVFVFAMMAFCLFSLTKLGINYIVNYEISHWYNFVQASMYHKYMPEDAMYLNTALILLLFGEFSKPIKWIGSVLFFVVIVLFGVRMGLFLNVIILSVYILLNIKSLFSIKNLLIGVGIIVVAFFLLSQSRYASDKFYDSLQKLGFPVENRVSDIGSEYHRMGLREQIWKSSIDLIKEKPVLGHGGGVEKKPLAAMNKKNGFVVEENYHSHNQYLSVMIQYGMLGIIWLIMIYAVLIREVFRKKSWIAGLIVMVMIISMIPESYLELQQGMFYFCTFVCVLMMKNRKDPVNNDV